MPKTPGHTDVAEPSTAVMLHAGAQRTLDAVFAHPLARNLEWRDVEALITTLGSVEPLGGGRFLLRLGQEQQTLEKPRSKDMPLDDVLAVRHLLRRAGFAPGGPAATASPTSAATAEHPAFMVVLDHHGARLHRLDAAPQDGPDLVFAPLDPHHHLHHLTHKNEDRERGQRAPEPAEYYERITLALADAGQVVVIGHGAGHSNAAHHLVEYLHTHHHPSHGRVVTEIVADLSALTPAQLQSLAHRALQ
ncbi:MAG: hypothetical protein NTV19_01055 [Burkholderiales bacterium]|nr:hypothetical protein [Burkholderiales bacterium]